MFSQVGLGKGDEVGIVGSSSIQPKHGLGSGGSGSGHGKLHPVLRLKYLCFTSSCEGDMKYK